MRQELNYDHLEQLVKARDFKELRPLLASMNEVDVAEFIAMVPEDEQAIVFRILPKELAASVFSCLEDSHHQEQLIHALTDQELRAVLEELFLDDAVDLIEDMPASVVTRILSNTDKDTRDTINQLLNYPKDSAGTLMTTEFVGLKLSDTVTTAFHRIREVGLDSETVYTCYVTKNRTLLGVVTVRKLLLADEDDNIADLMETNLRKVYTHDDKEDVAQLFAKYNFGVVPVVDNEGRLVGIITVDDIIDVLEEETTEDIHKMAAMLPSDKPYLRTSVLETCKTRIPWLMLLMLSATVTGWIITSFESALATTTILAAFIPMISGTGGNSGAQSSVAVIRALSLGEVTVKNLGIVIWKEVRVACLCGLALSIANYAKLTIVDSMILHNQSVTPMVSLVVCATLAFTVLCAKVVGCSMPILAYKVGIDPAVMAAPLITTVVDALSLLIYFGIATQLLGL
ncbi:MAG: magnesium transporter [Eubacteriales bacterium]